MAKHRIWLFAVALVLLAANINAEEEIKPIQSKIFVGHGRPILNTKDVDQKAFEMLQAKEKVSDENKKDQEPMIKIEPAVKIEDPVVVPAEEKTEGDTDVAAGDSASAPLPPILPFFNGMSPFMKSILSSVNSDNSADVASDPAAQTAADESQVPNRPRGVLTIVFMKAMRPSFDDASSDDKSKDPTSLMLEARSNFNTILKRILPQRLAHIFGGDNDPDSRPMRLIGGDDIDRDFARSQQHLLGGDHDLDRFRPLIQDSASNEQSDSSDENMFNRGPVPQIIVRTDNQPLVDLSDDMVRNYPQTNRCVMSFMRLKASAYYRTIVHLLFFSGIILLVLFMILLTIRVYRRRRALRFYNQNMHVAAISYEDMPRKTANGNLFLFRLGNLRNSYAQKQAAGEQNSEIKSSLLIQSPPAYEQVIMPSNTKIGAPKQDEDAKSLPPYDEALLEKPKSSDI